LNTKDLPEADRSVHKIEKVEEQNRYGYVIDQPRERRIAQNQFGFQGLGTQTRRLRKQTFSVTALILPKRRRTARRSYTQEKETPHKRRNLFNDAQLFRVALAQKSLYKKGCRKFGSLFFSERTGLNREP
jgi:hypothetical protein